MKLYGEALYLAGDRREFVGRRLFRCDRSLFAIQRHADLTRRGLTN